MKFALPNGQHLYCHIPSPLQHDIPNSAVAVQRFKMDVVLEQRKLLANSSVLCHSLVLASDPSKPVCTLYVKSLALNARGSGGN